MCPPGVDQTTRTDQRWYLLSPELRQRQSLCEHRTLARSGSKGPHNHIKNPETFWDAFQKLAKPSQLPARVTPGADNVVTLRHDAKLSEVERMPPELLDMILDDECLSQEDILAFGMSSGVLWCHAMSHLRRQASVAAWAGKPLLCTGTWLTDLPQPIYDEYSEHWKHEQVYANRTSLWWGACPARAWNWAAVSEWGGYEDVTGKSLEAIWLAARERVIPVED